MLTHANLKENKVMCNSWQAKSSPFRVTLTDTFRETQKLQTRGKRHLRINSPEQESPAEPAQPLCLEDEKDKGIRKEIPTY